MSRCVLDNKETGDEVGIGWDPGTLSFFAQVIKPGEERPSIWLHNETSPNLLIASILPYACNVDRGTLTKNLLSDREQNSERIYSIDGDVALCPQENNLPSIATEREHNMIHALLPLLHNRMNSENQVTPQFIGEFHGVESLPNGNYPAVYFWIDKQLNDSLRLSFNTPLLERWCVEEARKAGFSIDPGHIAVQNAITTLHRAATAAFQAAMTQQASTQPAATPFAKAKQLF